MEESANFIPLGPGRGSERMGSTSTSARDRPTSISVRRASTGHSILDGPKIVGATPGRLSHSQIYISGIKYVRTLAD